MSLPRREDRSVDADINSADWRVALARRLRERLTFVNLLRVLEGRPKPLSKILERLRPSLPVASDGEADGVLNGLCALISVARRQDDDAAKKLRPFLQVGLHLWVRELRRMVCRLCDNDGAVVAPIELAAAVAQAGVEQERYERFVQQRVKAGASILGMYPPGDDALAACRKWLDSGEPGDEQGPVSAEADSRAADQ